MEKKLIKIFAFLLLINFASISQGYTVEYGNKNAQEIGDVVFRDITDFGLFLGEIHGAIYVNHINKNVHPELSHSHKVIQIIMA